MTDHSEALSIIRKNLGDVEMEIRFWHTTSARSEALTRYQARAEYLRRSIAVLEADQTVPVEKVEVKV